MATHTAASDHAPTTDQQYVKKEKDEGIAQMIASLANEDEVKHDKPEDTPSSKTQEEEVKAELAAVEVEKPDDSPALEVSVEESLKHDKVEDAQSPTPPTEDDEKNVEPVVAVEKPEDSVPLDASVAVEDNVKEEKELVPDSHTISVTEPVHDAANFQPDEAPSTEPTVKETPPQQIENEPVETDEEKQVQPKIEDIPEASAETIEKPSNTAEANPLAESEGEVVKEAQVLETSSRVEEKPEPVATQVQEETEEPENELQEAEQPSMVAVNPLTESWGEVVKEVQVVKTSDQVEEKPEPVATQVQEKTEETEKELQEATQPSTVEVPPEPSAEADEKPNDTIEEKAKEASADVVEETKNNEAGPTEIVEAEPVVTEVDENQKEPEKQSLEQREEEQLDTSAITENTVESSDAIEEKTRELEFETETEVLKETNNFETEKAEPVAAEVDENQSEPEKQEEEEQPKTVVPETEAESAEQQDNIVEVHPPKDSDIEVVKESGNSELEAIPEKIEKPEPLSTEVEEKPREQLQVGEEVEEASKEVETKQEIVLETAQSEGTSDDTTKEEKIDKEEEPSLTENAAQVSSIEEPQANLVETSPEVAEKVVEEVDRKESSITDVIEGVTNEAAGIIENPEQASIDQEAKTDLKEEREYSVPDAVEEKVAVAVAANDDDNKESETPNAVPGSSREEEVESIKVEEQNEAKTATTKAGESVKDDNDNSVVDDKKEGNTETKVDEISRAVSEPVRETLASKFEEKEEESVETGVDKLEKEQTVEPEKTEVQATKVSDSTKTSKDLPKETPAKPAQKQSNNIISKVKQSLVKAKKAITGKSPSSKNLSSDPKGDIKVK